MKLKTEGLTLREARAALAYGYEVAEGAYHWRWSEKGLEFKDVDDEDNWSIGAKGPNLDGNIYRIIQPEPKRLSFDEAVELLKTGKPINIHTPTSFARATRTYDHIEGTDSLLWLDLAVRRGWTIEVVE